MLESSTITVTAPASHAGNAPTMTLADMNTRLRGVTIRAAFLDACGIQALKDGNWIVYAKADFPRIKAAIIEHVRGCE